ncbi:MAG: hypothetical protein L3J89_09905 [Gammaproteobacteria bacterium]|nr:hypothetical protein [Gammaproteobacteria bacterium]
MIKRLKDIPVYSSAQVNIEAEIFNTIRIATQRLALPIRLTLPRFQYIDVIIDHDAWACVDRSLNDLPIIAWTEFEITHRSALHLPVSCKISNYHFQSSQVVDGALSFTKMALEGQLSAQASSSMRQTSPSNISPLYCAVPNNSNSQLR